MKLYVVKSKATKKKPFRSFRVFLEGGAELTDVHSISASATDPFMVDAGRAVRPDIERPVRLTLEIFPAEVVSAKRRPRSKKP